MWDITPEELTYTLVVVNQILHPMRFMAEKARPNHITIQTRGVDLTDVVFKKGCELCNARNGVVRLRTHFSTSLLDTAPPRSDQTHGFIICRDESTVESVRLVSPLAF